MQFTSQELKKASAKLSTVAGCKGLSAKLAKAATCTNGISVKIPREPVSVSKHGQELYVIPCYNGQKLHGYTCLGFDVALKRATGYYQWLTSEGVEVEAPNPALRGTVEGYADYLRLADAAGKYHRRTGKRCEMELSPQLIGLEGKRVEVVTEYDETRRFIVGKSTGWCPCHLEIPRRDSHGGMPAHDRYKTVKQIA